MDYKTLPLDKWCERHVSSWLNDIKINEEYITKLYEEEVTGPVLREIDEHYLTTLSMKGGQIHLLIKKRNELLLQPMHKNAAEELDKSIHLSSKIADVSETCRTSAATEDTDLSVPKHASAVSEKKDSHFTDNQNAPQKSKSGSENENKSHEKKIKKQETQRCSISDGSVHKAISLQREIVEPLHLSKFRPFGSEDSNFKYVKNTVLQPETGIIDLITPCHEYKSFATAAVLERTRLQAKFANEVIRFGSACMNIRTNGTIHFGVMDSVENKGWEHGQIVGVPVHDKDIYVDALDYIERSFKLSERGAARLCIHPPKFIEVIEKDSEEQNFIIEVDIEPLFNIVKGKVFQVSLPKFYENSNKVSLEKKTMYQRVGTKSEPVKDEDNVAFIQESQDRDTRREQAELRNTADIKPTEDLGTKLSVLLTNGRKYMDNSLWYILVTNKCKMEDLQYADFLMRINIFCVFDFDPDSNLSGLCHKYKELHAPNLHSLKSYSNTTGMSPSEFKSHLHLFDQTSWIFCNGRNDYDGDDQPCDENTWVRTKKKHLNEVVSFICDDILPRGSFIVLFLLLSPVEKPIVNTFHEFYTEMKAMDNIICIAECDENYQKWANLAQASCNIETLNQRSVIGIKLSHVDATVQDMLPSLAHRTRNLPVSSKALCALTTPEEERMFSLEILCADECKDINLELLSTEQKLEIEHTFYRGGKVSWKNFWLADQKICGEVIERKACTDVQKILKGILDERKCKLPVSRIKIFHQPGSGGSTVARQVLWKSRKDLRCAVVKLSYPVATVIKHAVKFREYEENNVSDCLPVLLLVEDCDEEYLDELSSHLAKEMTALKPCFILLSCQRSNDPEKLCNVSPLETVAVTHKLTDEEKRQFGSLKRELLEKHNISELLIITFVLMSEEFNEQYVRNIVKHALEGIDHSSLVTRLMRYVALLNTYVQNSYISLSHCEAFLGIDALGTGQGNICRHYHFKNHLSAQAQLFLIDLTETTTWISCIHIIHPLVAKEILYQLSGNCPQIQIAMDLLGEDVLIQHRFGRDEFMKFIKYLFLRRYKKSRGDNVDSFFSPFILHVCKDKENVEKAIALFKVAYECFGKDVYFAQQLARLNYTYEKFEDAKMWAEVAKSHSPDDSYILDTEGQVYKKWFYVTMDKKVNELTPSEIVKLIELALKAMECFRAAEKASKSELESMNNSAYFSEVDVGCRLLQLLSSLEIFQTKETENLELLHYLLTEYIPQEIFQPWDRLHSRLKALRQNILNALEWISEELSYFQTDKNEDQEPNNKVDEHVYNPRIWLAKKTRVFARFFCSTSFAQENCAKPENPNSVSRLVRQMNIYMHGGGSATTILSFLSDMKDTRSREKLARIINLYPKDIQRENVEDTDLINYIMCHIALGCVFPESSQLLPFQKLREVSRRFSTQKKMHPPGAYLLLTLLYWPDDLEDRKHDQEKDSILTSALKALRQLHDTRIKNIPFRKKRTHVQFFLGEGSGLYKITHRSKIEKLIAGTLYERRMKWQNGEVWKIDIVHQVLKPIRGWTEDGKLFVRGHCKKSSIEIIPLHFSSVPQGNENVTFYLGFSYNGLVAYNVQVTS